MKERVRHYLPFIGIPNAVLVLGIIVVCLATILLSGGRPAALPAAIAETWFVLHGVPVTFDGVTLGAIPLLPAIGVAALIAWRVRSATRERVSILDLYAIFGLVVLLPLTLSGIAWFMVADASAVFPVQPPAIHKALFTPVFIHLAGMACGMSGKLWKALLHRLGAPISLVDAARAATNLSLRLAGAAAVVYLIMLASGYARVAELAGEFPLLGAGGIAGLTAVSLLYLPNAVVSTLAVLLGAPFRVATGGVSLFNAALVPLPPLPLFGAVPGSVAPWAPVLLVVPAAVIIHFVVSRRLSGLEVAAAAVWSAALAAAAGLLSGGEAGAYGFIGPDPWLFALAALVWVGVIAGLAWAIALVKNSRGARTTPASAEVVEDDVERGNADAEILDAGDPVSDGDAVGDIDDEDAENVEPAVEPNDSDDLDDLDELVSPDEAAEDREAIAIAEEEEDTALDDAASAGDGAESDGDVDKRASD